VGEEEMGPGRDGVGDRSLREEEGRGAVFLVDPVRVPSPGPELFEAEAWRSQGRVVETFQGRGTTLVVRPGNGMGRPGRSDEEWVLRHLLRGGLPGRILEDRYLWLGHGRARPFREVRLLALLREWGLPVPEPVGAAVRRWGATYTGDLLTTRVEGRPLAVDLAGGEPRPGDWHRIGRTIRTFHERGVFHADLSAGNILVGDSSVHLIDFDRGRIKSRRGWRRRNLARLERSARKLLGREKWESRPWQACRAALLEGYRNGATGRKPG
jgi:3-deoxy-D-manno-octulosonic acid kinase